MFTESQARSIREEIDRAVKRERARTVLMIKNAAHQAERWAVQDALRFLADLLESEE